MRMRVVDVDGHPDAVMRPEVDGLGGPAALEAHVAEEAAQVALEGARGATEPLQRAPEPPHEGAGQPRRK